MPWNEEIRAAWASNGTSGDEPRDPCSHDAAHDGSGRAGGPSDNPVVPTLVVHHAEDAIIPPAKGRVHRRARTDAKYVELPGRNWYHSVEPGWRASFQEIAEFLTGHQAEVADDRVLATVLFTDIVGLDAPRRRDRRPRLACAA